MVRLRSAEVREVPIEWAGQSVVLVSRAWIATMGTREFAVGGSYHRPVRIEASGASSKDIVIRDHIAIAKYVAAAVLLAAALIRRVRR